MVQQSTASATAELTFEIPGQKLPEDLAKQVKEKIRSLCGWRAPSFPGSQPVSLTRASLAEISRNPYVACEKTDGVRLLLFAAAGRVFLIDRKEEVREVRMHLPRENNLEEAHQTTLLDGEIVMDEELEPEVSNEQSEGEGEGEGEEERKSAQIVKRKYLRYLVYDAICIQRDSSIKETNLLNRLACVYKEVIKPMLAYKEQMKKQGKDTGYPFEIYVKDFYEIWDIDIIKNYSKKLPHLSDGIIFTPVRLPYISGTCKQLLKWKPPHLNTVDFSVDFIYDEDGRPRLVQLFVAKKGFRTFMGHFCAPFGDVYKELLERAERGAAAGIIVECYWVPDKPVMTFVPKLRDAAASAPGYMQQQTLPVSKRHPDGKPPYDLNSGDWVPGGWVAERIRLDKQLPNDYRIVHKILESIEDGVRFEELQEEFQKYRSRGKKRAADLCILPPYYEEKRSDDECQQAAKRQKTERSESPHSSRAPLTTEGEGDKEEEVEEEVI